MSPRIVAVFSETVEKLDNNQVESASSHTMTYSFPSLQERVTTEAVHFGRQVTYDSTASLIHLDYEQDGRQMRETIALRFETAEDRDMWSKIFDEVIRPLITPKLAA